MRDDDGTGSGSRRDLGLSDVGTKRFKSFSHSLVASLGLFELGSFLPFFFVFLSLFVSVSVSLSLSRLACFSLFCFFFSFLLVVFGLFCVCVCVCVCVYCGHFLRFCS